MSTARPFLSSINEPFLLLKWKVQAESHLFLSTTVLTYKSPSEGSESDQELKLKSTVEGMILQLLVKEGDVVQPGSPLLMLKSCTHELIVKEICAQCGADLQKLFERLPGTYLKVTPEQAEQLEIAGEQRLLKERKLALLICIDKTLVDTVDVQGLSPVWEHEGSPENYCTKVRPGTRKFLEAMSQCFELHFFTDGKICYAKKMAEILDPDGNLFAHRIWTRHDCFAPESTVGNLKAIFPHGTSMVCIIDTQEDKFKDCSSNVIFVKPFTCLLLESKNNSTIHEIDIYKTSPSFCPVGDINADNCTNSIAHEKCDFNIKDSKSSQNNTLAKNEGNSESRDGEICDTNCAQDANQKPMQFEHNNESDAIPFDKVCDKTVTSNANEISIRKELCREFCNGLMSNTGSNHNSDSCSDKQNLVPSMQKEEDCSIMKHLGNFLINIHKAYYELYDQMVKQRMYIIHHKPIPELKNVIPYYRHCVLKGVNIVFSGVIPTNVQKETSILWNLAKSLGANVSDELVLHDKVRGTTHIIAAKLGTNKTNMAKKFHRMHIVTPGWLYKCATYWRHVDEEPFHLKGENTDNLQSSFSIDSVEDLTVFHSVSREMEEEHSGNSMNSKCEDNDTMSDNTCTSRTNEIDRASCSTPEHSATCLTAALNLSPQELKDMNSEVLEECTSEEDADERVLGESTYVNCDYGDSDDDDDCDDEFEDNHIIWSERRKRHSDDDEMLESGLDFDSTAYSDVSKRKKRRHSFKSRFSSWDCNDNYDSCDSDDDFSTSESDSDKYGCVYVEDEDTSFL